MATNDQSTFTQSLGYVVDQFDELQDMTYDDNLLLEEYVTLKLQKQQGIAINESRLATLETRFTNKIITASRWNKFQNCLVNMEQYIKNEVDTYVDTKQTEMQTYVTSQTNTFNAKLGNFNHKSDWNPTTQYYQWNTVTYQQESYLSLQSNINQQPNPSADTVNWAKIASKGSKGDIGVSVNFRGDYNTGVTYNLGDAVVYTGALYFAKQTTTNNYPTNLTYWQIFDKITVGSVSPSAPQTYQMWFDTGNIILKYYDGTVWKDINQATLDKIGVLSSLTTTNKTNLVLSINEVNANIGTLSALTTTSKTNLVSSANELKTNIGTVSSLTTTSKTNLVTAVNEVNANIGTLSTLTTVNKANLVSAINEVSTQTGGYILDVDNASWVGITSETDALAEKSKSIYANTLTTGSKVLGSIIIDKLKLGYYGLMFRLKSTNNVLTTNAIQIEIQKNISGTYTTQKTYILKANDFISTTDYKCFFTSFEYKGGKATNNQVKILITLLTQTTAYKVSLDYIQINPVNIGVFE